MEENSKVLRVCQNKTKNINSKFTYSISSILQNLYDAFNSSKITAKEKLEIKSLIFSRSGSIAIILDELKDTNLFDVHLNSLKILIKSRTKNDEKNQTSKRKTKNKQFPTLNIFPKKNVCLTKKFFKENNEASEEAQLNHSLLMDSNESIIFIEKTNQNLFSEEEDENLSTTLGLELFNLSTNPSTPLNTKKNIKKNEESNPSVSRSDCACRPKLIARQEKFISKTSNNIYKIEVVAKGF